MSTRILLAAALSTLACTAAPAGSSAEAPAAQAATQRVIINAVGEDRVPFKIEGTLEGLAAGRVELLITGQTVALAANGPFEISGTAPRGQELSVAIAAQPIAPWQTCIVRGVSAVICGTRTFDMVVSVQGLRGAVVLRRDDGEIFSAGLNGRFAFPSKLKSGTSYNVWIENAPENQDCSLSRSEGTIAGEDAQLAVACSAR